MLDSLLESLNSEQRQAVTAPIGPVLVIAGPGTGKTRTLASRIAYLILKQYQKKENIFALTFTNKAAGELKQRIEKIIEGSSSDLFMGTFHSFCLYLLKEYDSSAKDTGLMIVSSYDQQRIIQEIQKKMRSLTNISARRLLSEISLRKNGLRPHENYDTSDFRELYARYQETLSMASLMDFDDLQTKCIEMLEHNINFLADVQNKCRHIFVDEYQDINSIQYRLLKLISEKSETLFAVGDADQAIYAFRGANIENFLSFRKDFPNVREVYLNENYRNSPQIILAARGMISKNVQRIDFKVVHKTQTGPKIAIFRLHDEKEEAKFICSYIENLLGGTSMLQHDIGQVSASLTPGACHFSDFAVFYRLNTQGRALEDEFQQRGIPYQRIGGARFFEKIEIIVLISYLRTIFNHKDDLSFLRIINVPNRGLGDTTINLIKSLSKKLGISPLELIEKIASGGEDKQFASYQLNIFEKLSEQLQRWRENSDRLSSEEIIGMLIQELNFEKYFPSNDALQNMTLFKRMASGFGSAPASQTMPILLEQLALHSPTDEFDPRANMVTLMTLHASKGLEFDTVFVIGTEDGLIPYVEKKHFIQQELEEERRLFYVGITRAKRLVVVTSTESRFLYGKRESFPESRFISEIQPEFIERLEVEFKIKQPKRENPQLKLF